MCMLHNPTDAIKQILDIDKIFILLKKKMEICWVKMQYIEHMNI